MKRTTKRPLLAGMVTAGLLCSTLVTTSATAQGSPHKTAVPSIGPALATMLQHQKAAPAKSRAAITSSANDLTGDGIDDVIARDRVTTRLDVFAGSGSLNGAATLAGPTQIRASTPDRVWFGQGDLNGDGRNDVASIDSAGVMYAAYNQGTVAGAPQLSADASFISGFTPGSPICLADFVGSDPKNPLEPDGRADIIIKNASTKAIDLYVNDGMVNGKPSYSYRGQLLTAADYVTGIQLADLTGDYFKDILITMSDGTLWMLDLFADVDSSGKPVAKWFKIIGSGMNTADHILFPDFNHDDYPDFAARLTASGELRGVLHSGVWNPAKPETVFNAATGQLIKSGWSNYDWVF
ncbi:VCBS repeat-containing protein [Amycolatopsis rubida]|uniref:VCBS repeat-containing protein n=1 Tax=Amycolatopsis rubida TaxID=112413 RepID=A0ABX0BQG2_9PSEU|nr:MULTISPECIES: VCBS repeat-containing protein [Amycolatopsis]MYW90835.1 hypothetical protein [Amycolatopsis rubida]NEC55818.1 VCBS repeat-containing protein [Amycolatopsis rubida]OAP26103.1 FG-GAP repeat protein [Amycolatopsis sp. M39]